MREYTLSFSIATNNPIYGEITTESIFENKGQKFKITGIDDVQGSNNIVQFTAEHISYNLNNYFIPDGYGYIGSLNEILEDMLSVSLDVNGISAKTEFSAGECYDGLGEVTFSLPEAVNTTLRDAIVSLTNLGVEIEYDNFTINLPKARGADSGITFDYDRNLSTFRRRWETGNGWTYEASIADLQRIPSHEGDKFECGDYVTINDRKNTNANQHRVISYSVCDDDPTKDTITLGVFAIDSSTVSIETELELERSVKQGERYSNVTITHSEGFKATNLSNTLRVLMNAQDCFAVQVNDGNGWKTVNSLEEFGLLIDRLTTPDAKNKFYARVGKISSGDEYGIQLVAVKSGGTEEVILEIGQIDDSYSPVIYSELPINIKTKDSIVLDAEYIELNDSWHYTGSFNYVKEVLSNGGATFGKITVENGLITEVT